MSEDKVANIFTNSILKTVEEGFSDVAGLINEAPEFEVSPEIMENDYSKFTLVVIAGNLQLLPQHFSTHQEKRLTSLILDRFSALFQLGRHEFMAMVADYQKFLSKVNHPSTNVLYAMSKAVFFKYDLGKHQEAYFRKLNAPNPLFLKRLDDVMENFIWDWDHLKENYNLNFK